MNFGWLVIICETLWLVMWLRTRTYGYVMIYVCDFNLLILWLVLVLVEF
jgi:hypothetical protein